MILRLLTFVKHILLTIIRITCKILRCGRRKKAVVDDSLPTDVIIGDAPNPNRANYPSNNAFPNGYDTSQPSYYDKAVAHQQMYPYQDQYPTEHARSAETNEDVQMEAWEQWGYEDSSLQMGNHQNQPHASNPTTPVDDTDENVNYFFDMEPSVKVKKIVIKKKSRSTAETRNRLAVDQDLDFKTSSELDSWQDLEDSDGDGGWMDEEAELGDIDTAKVAKEAREIRKQERLKRTEQQKKQRHAKKSHHQDHKFATKVS